MKSVRGRLFAEYSVDCAGCRTAVPTGETSRTEAGRSMRARGWRKIDGLWLCEDCAPDRAELATPAHPPPAQENG